MYKITTLILIMILTGAVLSASISVFLKNEQKNDALQTTELDSRSYVDVELLNKMIGSICKQEALDNRLYLTFCGDQIIFLINSSYFTLRNSSYNMHFPFLHYADKYYVPENFVTDILPQHFPENVKWKSGILTVTRPKDNSIRRVVIDAGHGGKDPGAVGKMGTREKDINLSVALKLKYYLENELGISVLMTRADDRFITLGQRTKFANDNDADLFISIHTNASQSRSADGMETYYLATSVTTDARAVEALENGVVELYEGLQEKQKYDALAFILSDMSQTEHLENSNNLAFYVQKNMVAGARGSDRGVKQASFYVLRGAFMPAILIELGFISNPQEEAKLATQSYQNLLARTIFEGVKRFKYRYDRIRSA